MKNEKPKRCGYSGSALRIILPVVTCVALNPMLTTTLAQYTGQLAERDSKPILEYFLAIGFTVVCVGIAAMNPKRSHQA